MSLVDADFALRLEPQNQEIKKQQAEVKSLLQKVKLNPAGTLVISMLQLFCFIYLIHNFVFHNATPLYELKL